MATPHFTILHNTADVVTPLRRPLTPDEAAEARIQMVLAMVRNAPPLPVLPPSGHLARPARGLRLVSHNE